MAALHLPDPCHPGKRSAALLRPSHSLHLPSRCSPLPPAPHRGSASSPLPCSTATAAAAKAPLQKSSGLSSLSQRNPTHPSSSARPKEARICAPTTVPAFRSPPSIRSLALPEQFPNPAYRLHCPTTATNGRTGWRRLLPLLPIFWCNYPGPGGLGHHIFPALFHRRVSTPPPPSGTGCLSPVGSPHIPLSAGRGCPPLHRFGRSKSSVSFILPGTFASVRGFGCCFRTRQITDRFGSEQGFLVGVPN